MRDPVVRLLPLLFCLSLLLGCERAKPPVFDARAGLGKTVPELHQLWGPPSATVVPKAAERKEGRLTETSWTRSGFTLRALAPDEKTPVSWLYVSGPTPKKDTHKTLLDAAGVESPQGVRVETVPTADGYGTQGVWVGLPGSGAPPPR